MTALTQRAVPVLVFAYPLLLLSVRSGTNAVFLLLIVLAFFEIALQRRRFFVGVWDNNALAYSLAMASFTLATLISQAGHLEFTGGPYDGAARFLFAIPIFLFLRRMPVRSLTVVQYGYVGGSLAALLIALLFPPPPGERFGSYYLNPIHYGDLALILGLLSVLSIRWERDEHLTISALKVAALVAGLWVSIVSGTRGGWLAIPLVFATWALLSGSRITSQTKVAFAIAALAAMALIYLLSSSVNERIDLMVRELTHLQAMKDSSTGLRIQIWTAALYLFEQNPLFGVGPDQFGAHSAELAAAGYLTPLAAQLSRSEVHNEILTRAVTLGVFGLVSILAIYIVPFALFFRASKGADRVQRTAGLLGACFVVGFFVFGLTVETFDLKTTATFYSLNVAVLLAIATNRENAARAPKTAPSGMVNP